MVPVNNFLHKFSSRWYGLSGNLRGILWITLGTIAFALNDVLIKLLGRKFSPVELAFCRYSIGFIILSPIFFRMGVSGLKTKRIGIHLLRLIFACTAQVGIFYAVIHMFLADVTAISFSRPLFTTIISVIILSELVSYKRWVATAIGFIGVLIMVRPGHAGFDPVAVIAVMSACTFALTNVLIRLMSTTEPPNRILFYYHLGGMLIFLGPAIWLWQMPVGNEWLLLIGIGVLTTIGMTGFIRAFSVGEANTVGPMEYIRLIYAGMLGYLVFGEIPDLWTGLGAGVIIAATLYIVRQETVSAKNPNGV